MSQISAYKWNKQRELLKQQEKASIRQFKSNLYLEPWTKRKLNAMMKSLPPPLLGLDEHDQEQTQLDVHDQKQTQVETLYVPIRQPSQEKPEWKPRIDLSQFKDEEEHEKGKAPSEDEDLPMI
jgi:hypothetical protein